MKTSAEFAYTWQPAIAGIELFSAQLVRHRFSKHIHEEYTIGLNEAGLGEFLYHGEIRSAHPGSFNLINPGEVHTGQCAANTGWAFRNLYLSVPCLQQVLAQLEWKGRDLPWFREPVVRDGALQSSFNHLFQALNRPAQQLEQESLLLEFLWQLITKHTEPGATQRSPQAETKAIAVVRAYIEAHYSENIAIDTLGQLVNLSPYYLIRSFHQQVGLPPHQYQKHWQLVQAKRSLRTSKSLSEIAHEHGFYDQSHLNRAFKQVFAITPGQYQKSSFIQYPPI